jgi:hypothetical protein
MASYAARARELAAGLAALDGVRVNPDPPHTNAFQLFVDVAPGDLAEAGLRIAEETRTALVLGWDAADVPGWAFTEITVGDATLAWPLDEQLTALADQIALARTLAAPQS